MQEELDIIQRFSVSLEAYWRGFLEALPALIAGVLIFAVFSFVASVLKRVTTRSILLSHVDSQTTQILGSVVKLAILSLGAITALGTMGVNIGALIAGLGLTGFAVGLALKDILSNFVGGLLVLIYRPFARGDFITVAGQTGQVSEINLRYTKILDPNGNLILVPNAKLFSEVIRVEREKPQGTDSRPA